MKMIATGKALSHATNPSIDDYDERKSTAGIAAI